jgi:hypothetical protein
MARWQPPEEQVVEASKPSRWPVAVLLLALLGVALAGLWMIRRRMQPPQPRVSATAADVRSEITGVGDSLEVAVSWRLRENAAMGMADSVRVEVGLANGRESHVGVSPAARRTDTLRLRAPTPGETATGYSCVAAVYGSRLSRETCTPWQYVRPSSAPPPPPAAPDTTAKRSRRTAPSTAAATAPSAIVRIVVEPDGQQVDPDVDGKCAAWQRRFPDRSVWIDVNRQAVPECTGPNGKPTVAQFCAFAVLADGRQVKLENSANNPYCERLFQAWARERVT